MLGEITLRDEAILAYATWFHYLQKNGAELGKNSNAEVQYSLRRPDSHFLAVATDATPDGSVRLHVEHLGTRYDLVIPEYAIPTAIAQETGHGSGNAHPRRGNLALLELRKVLQTL